MLLKINFDRLKSNILELSQIGKRGDGGLYRVALSEEDLQAREWLKNKILEAGLQYETDSAANQFGRLPVHYSARPFVSTGSHLDTVPCGGMLDGALGVLCGLEALQSIKESGQELSLPLELINFTDEEGRFGGMFGSKAISGKLSLDELSEAQDLNGVALDEAMSLCGLSISSVSEAVRAPETFHAFVELHIEQGPVLFKKEIPVGVVEAIAGLFKWSVTFMGESNHAGTTPMDMRRDALSGAAEFIRKTEGILHEHGSKRSVCTIGSLATFPGAANVIPGVVEFSLDVRDTDRVVLKQLEHACKSAIEEISKKRELSFEIEELSFIEPRDCDKDRAELIQGVAHDLSLSSLTLPSGAAHDAQNMADLTRASMIFVPSKNGVSHSPDEWTEWEDIEAGANVLVNTMYRLAV